MLALTDQPDNKALVQEVYGDRVAYVPYTIPGFALAKAVAEVFDKHPKAEGLVLLQHGIFTMGDTAEQAYGRMIEFVTMAEERLKLSAQDADPGQAAGQHCLGAGNRAHPARRGGDREERHGRHRQAPDPGLPHQSDRS